VTADRHKFSIYNPIADCSPLATGGVRFLTSVQHHKLLCGSFQGYPDHWGRQKIAHQLKSVPIKAGPKASGNKEEPIYSRKLKLPQIAFAPQDSLVPHKEA
jgi:hypothetical protein